MIFELNLAIDFLSQERTALFFKSIQPDIVRSGIKDVEVDLKLIDSKLVFKIKTESFSKFKGFINTLLRLISVTEELIEGVIESEL